MPEINEGNIVGILREKTQGATLEQYLKTGIGGYTKKSVMEYLAALRKQQQATAETFNQNLQTLLSEKESLQSQNESLLIKLKKVETDYRTLSDEITSFHLDNQEYTLQDIISLKSTIAALEGEKKKLGDAGHGLEIKIDRLNNEIKDKEKAIEQSRQETRTQRELLVEEKGETIRQRETVSKLSGTVDELKDEIKYLKGSVSEGRVADLNTQIHELMVNASAQEEIITRINGKLEDRETRIQTLSDENTALRGHIENLARTIDNLTVQNEKLVGANHAFSGKLEELQKSLISLIGEKSDITVEKLIVGRKLDEANRTIASLQMDGRKQQKAEELAAVQPDEKAEEQP